MAGELIKVTGIEEVQRMLRDAPKSVVARGYVKALGAGIGVIRAEMDIRTPVRVSEFYSVPEKGEKHPGDLKRALATDITLDSQFRGGTASIGYGSQSRVAGWVEYGHRIVRKGGMYVDNRGRRRKGTVTGQVPPHPWMRPTFDATADQAMMAFADSLERTLKEPWIE